LIAIPDGDTDASSVEEADIVLNEGQKWRQTTKKALDVFKHFGTNPRQGLLPDNFITIAAKDDWRQLDVIEGVKLGFAKGFFDDGSKYACRNRDLVYGSRVILYRSEQQCRC
jgi:hypothetical protein